MFSFSFSNRKAQNRCDTGFSFRFGRCRDSTRIKIFFRSVSYLDFINLMAYDFHGKWERETGHNAPLYSSSLDSEWQKQLSVDNAATMWVKLGAPKEKLIIGMPTYGRSFTLSNSANFRVHSPANGGGKAGEYTKESGFLAYYEVLSNLVFAASNIERMINYISICTYNNDIVS